MEAKMQALWDYVFSVLYNEKTHLVYEHRTNYISRLRCKQIRSRRISVKESIVKKGFFS